MTEAELAILSQITKKLVTVSGSMLENQTPRTLLYGYTCERDTFHIYLTDAGMIVRVIYDHYGMLLGMLTEADTPLLVTQCIPDKRVYAHHSDFEFCALLHKAGVSIPFTTYQEWPAATWSGAQLFELETRFTATDFDLEALAWTPCDLGLSELFVEGYSSLIASIDDVIRAQMAGYLRALAFPKKESGTPMRWLVNIEGGINYAVQRHVAEMKDTRGEWYAKEMEAPCVTFQIDPDKAEAIINRAKALLESKVTELLSR